MSRFEDPLPKEVISYIERNCRVGTSDYSSSLELAARDAEVHEDIAKHVASMIAAVDAKVKTLLARRKAANNSIRSQTR